MSTLIVILSHSGYNEVLKRHWPYMLKADCDILGVGRENTICVWPRERLVGTVNIGMESGAVGHNHIVRLIRTLEHCLNNLDLKSYQSFCITEADSIFLRPPPPIKLDDFYARLSGYRNEEFRGQQFVHTPWYFGRIMAGKVVKYGKAMLWAGLIERGLVDRWLGLMIDLYDIKWTDTNGQTYSQNTLDTPLFIAQAKQAVAAGAWHVHGIKTKEQLEAIF